MSPLRPSMQMALVLLQKGADVNAQEHVEIGHSTALHHAIRNKDLVVCWKDSALNPGSANTPIVVSSSSSSFST